MIINIGRQFGSGGKAVASVLGSKLEIPVYDKELLQKAAEDSGFAREIFEGRDEDIKGFKMGLDTGLMNSIRTAVPGFGEAQLFNIQSETIRHIADGGSAVIVGRCSDYILRDYPDTLDVFITAPMEERVKRVCERCEVPLDKAESYIQKKDKKRSSYYNCYTFGNWGVADNYDLCLDSSLLGIDGTADFIIEFARRKGLL